MTKNMKNFKYMLTLQISYVTHVVFFSGAFIKDKVVEKRQKSELMKEVCLANSHSSYIPNSNGGSPKKTALY